jgi:hypothetical protein
MFIGIDYSPLCVALVTRDDRSGEFYSQVAYYHGVHGQRQELVYPNWKITVHRFRQNQDDIAHYQHIKQFVINVIRRWKERYDEGGEGGGEPIGLEDNLHHYTGSNQFAQMAEIKAILALAFRELNWNYMLISATSARAMWIRMPPSIRHEWSRRNQLTTKRRLLELFQIRNHFRFPSHQHPYSDIIDAYVQHQAVSTRPVAPPRRNKYATRLLRDFL